MKTSELLTKAFSHIDTIHKWCHNFMGLDAKNEPTRVGTDKVCRVCALGALEHEHRLQLNAGVPSDEVPFLEALRLLDANSRDCGIVSTNDRLGYEAVVEAYQASIAQSLAMEKPDDARA